MVITIWKIGKPEVAGIHSHQNAFAQIFGDRNGFLLRKGAHHADEHLVGHQTGVDALFFKNHRHAQLSQFPNRSNAVRRVSGKAG